ncbi:MAG: hypothetical protein KDK78_01955, partial [Chlamydiia bacterium]|nr:hypothetical protein [Chlamydiia bacterium]
SKHTVQLQTALSLSIAADYEIATASACKLIAHMLPDDLIRPHSGSATYLELAMQHDNIDVADALRAHMHPHDFNEIAETLQPEATDDDWKLILTQKTACKGVKE